MTDLVKRLREQVQTQTLPMWLEISDAADEIERQRDEIERLRAALKSITDHFADVMSGPLVAGASVVIKDGITYVTIGKAEALVTLETTIRDEIRTTLEAREQARAAKNE